MATNINVSLSIPPKTPDLIRALDELEGLMSQLEESHGLMASRLQPVLCRAGCGSCGDESKPTPVPVSSPITERLHDLQKRASALIERQKEEILDRLEI
ncbi:hypothetical protein QZM78_11725 [Burkholderia multivorans]|uniref:hypothetical protein n=1 Tax=Burkholderia multivorans TaxID=87883 RepID=UPI001C227FB2|nr:hypothetical protein [Burkholderia multivorans]MBU9317227.1 hypothetical protein [Burkholderia multivorans]MCA8335224.1 hypothetical protein [Burkholderia multivorans]MDN7445899.1 hypothetical protein [Burkholderia multivorans]MDN7744715.1 hypothetical protein [Burkholderia multivorans]